MNYTELVEQAMKKDEKAIGKLFELTSQKGYYVALKYLKNKEDAQDILQDSYVSAFTKLDSLKNPEKFEKWLFQIIANKAKNYLVKNKPLFFEQMENDDEDAVAFEETITDDRMEFQPKENCDYQELKDALKILIDELPEDQRMCLLMYYFEELSVNEIADSLELNVNTIKSRLNYARSKVKTKIEDLKKKGTHLYGIAPIPFMLWALTEDAKASTLPLELSVDAILSETTKQIGIASTSSHVATSTVKTSFLKSTMFKVILGVALGGSAIIGGTVLMNQSNSPTNEEKQTENQSGDEDKPNSITYEEDEALADVPINNNIDIIKELPAFEETPIDMYGKGYIVKVDGKYGFMNTDGNWLIPNEYEQLYFHGYSDEPEDQVCFIKGKDEETISDGIDLKRTLDQSADTSCGNTGYGGYNPEYITLYEDDLGSTFYYDSETGKKISFHDLHHTSEYSDSGLLDAYGDNRSNLMIVHPSTRDNQIIEDTYYAVSNSGNVYGPFHEGDTFSFNLKHGNIAENTPVKGLVITKYSNSDTYHILDRFGTSEYEKPLKSAELISYNTVKIKSGKYMGIIDESLQVVLYGEFEDVSKPMNQKAFVKINGKWTIIELK